jgi:hypothetical protein
MKLLKEMSEAELKEYRRIKNMIRRGKIPRYSLIKGTDGKLQRSSANPKRRKHHYLKRLTWKSMSAIHLLMDI